MNISLEWLAEYLPGKTDLHAAADALTNGGLVTENFSKVGEDEVMDVEVTSNRGDCLSHVGVARELAVLMRREFKDVDVRAVRGAHGEAASVAIEAKELCPHYTARVIRGVKVGPSPEWMQRRLIAVGLRPINNVVDVTNYVMFEMGQPLHAFDYEKVGGRKIVVRTARAGEKLVSIDGHERTLAPWMLVIADESRPVALAGVMGGKESEVSEGTTTVLLESARFEALSVRRTARALAMKSDSSYRFERGIDPTLPARASARAAQLIVELAGGEVVGGMVEAWGGGEVGKGEVGKGGSGEGGRGYVPKKLTLRLEKVKRVLGVELAMHEVVGALAKLGFNPVSQGDRVDVTVPSWRLDINIEVDLVEEVARVVGYGRIPTREEISIRLTPPDVRSKTIDAIRSVLVGAGYFEAVTFSWVADALAGDFVPAGARGLPRADQSVRKADGQLRPSLLPGLLEAVRRNETGGVSGAKLFEVGSTFYTDAAGKIVEKRKLGIVGSEDLHEVRGAVEAVLSKLNPAREVRVVPEKVSGYAVGAAGRVEWGGEAVGYIGRVAKEVDEKLGLRAAPCAAELEEEKLLAGVAGVVTLKALPKFPAVRRDLSLVVKERVRYEEIEGVVRGLALKDLEDVEYVTTYRGRPLEKGEKSVTVQLVFRSSEGTLTSEGVEGSVQRVVEEAKARVGAGLRS